MNRSKSKTHDHNSSVVTALWTWLALGVAVMLLSPRWRGSDPAFGWLPFWLVIAPLIDLAVLRRRWLAATSRAFLVRTRRRRRLAPRQARLLSRRHARVARLPRIAASAPEAAIV